MPMTEAPMSELLPDAPCPECANDASIVPSIVMTPGGPDRLLAVCTTCGRIEDHGPVDIHEAA